MWFAGAFVGLVGGYLMDWGAGALILAAAGAILFPVVFGKKARKPAGVPRPAVVNKPTAYANETGGQTVDAGHTDDMEPVVDVFKLQRRVAELELRLRSVERRLLNESPLPVDIDIAATGSAPLSVPVPQEDHLPAFPVAANRAASVTATRAELAVQPAPPSATQEPTPAMRDGLGNFARETATQALTQETPAALASEAPSEPTLPLSPTPRPSPTATTAPRAPVRPPPPPAVPWRDRLPAPIARLIFGGNTLVKLGVLILFLGLAFLLRYTAERVTVPLELRYAGVALVGAALLLTGWLLRRKRAGYALILQGAGIGVFYLTTLAAMKLSGLLPPTAGFAFLLAVAVLSAVLAVVQNAPVLAIVAVLEGFAAPVLASTGENRPVGLFTYLLVLDVGIVLIAWFKAWRVLNLIGFVGTFTLAAAWAQRSYTDDQFGIVQPFLIVFFLLFTAVGLLFARRTLADAPPADELPLATRAAQTLRRVGRVDSALTFGTPMVAFGMQYLLMKPWEFGAAFSALGLAAFYLLLGRLVFSTQGRGLALLAEAYAIVGVIFATLAIPLGLEGQWTGATWAVEAAGMYWLGIRQSRPYARAFSFVVLLGAAFKLLQDVSWQAVANQPVLQGSVIGPLLLALGVFVMWALHRRHKMDATSTWEKLAGTGLPWLGMAALTLLPWQWFTPAWAAAATAVLASAAFVIAVRFKLPVLVAVTGGMQALAVAGFVATLHRGTSEETLASGWQGAVVAGVIALSVLGSAAWAMAQAHRAALARGVQPQWSVANIIAVVTGVVLLHLATLFQLSLREAALLWPFTAAVVFWIALRVAHGPMAVLAAALHVAAATFFFAAPLPAERVLNAFAHLGFWTAVALAITTLLAGDWVREEARARPDAPRPGRWTNAWCRHAVALWAPVVVGICWWLMALTFESLRVLNVNALPNFAPAACVAIVLGTSALAWLVARWRDWSQLGRATLMTLPGLVLVAAVASGTEMRNYVPSAALGWLVWPLAGLWHWLLLRGQQTWVSSKRLSHLHTAGVWFFVLLAARECQWQFSRLGDDWSSWPLLGWALVPALALWAMRSAFVLRRWPLTTYRAAYLEVAAVPMAAYLLVWAWASNAGSPGNASPLPYLPLLNPLELANWLVLVALLAWWRALPESAAVRLPVRGVQAVAGITALALLTGMVLRSCHHYAGVPWDFDALYASRLTQAALSITWALCGVAAMVLGNAKALRLLWLAGAALLGAVVLKLFFVELADQGGLFRIVSFIAVGALLLLVGYFAPVPPARADEPLPEASEGETA